MLAAEGWLFFVSSGLTAFAAKDFLVLFLEILLNHDLLGLFHAFYLADELIYRLLFRLSVLGLSFLLFFLLSFFLFGSGLIHFSFELTIIGEHRAQLLFQLREELF